MPQSLSAEKRVRQNAKSRARNRARKDAIKAETRSFTAAVAEGDSAKAAEQFNVASSRLARVAAKGTIHKNTAARKRSRMALALNKLQAAGTP